MQKDQRKWPNRLIWITLIIVVIFFPIRLYYRLTDDFRISHMTHQIPLDPEWGTEITLTDRHLMRKMFQKPFYYIGKGAQSYAFESEDGEYVLKFFKFKHLKPNWTTELLPDIGPLAGYKQKRSLRKKRLINSVFSGYKLAYDRHREETGVIFLHLNSTEDLQQSVTLFDKVGRKYELDLDPIVFVVQEYAVTSRNELAEALDGGDLGVAKHRIRQLIDLYLSEYQKGIYDRDHGVLHNTGFVGEKPIHLDVGKLTDEPKMRGQHYWQPDLEIVVRKFHLWLKDYYPQYYDELMTTIEEELSNAFGKPYQFSS